MTFWQKAFIALCIFSLGAHVLFPIWTFRLQNEDYAAPKYVRSFVAQPPANPEDMPGEVVIDYSATFLSILSWILRGLILYWAFAMARYLTASSSASKARAYITTLISVGVIALISWSMYGTHTEDSDPIYGGGDSIEDFTPTPAQRNEHGLIVFSYLIVPALVGTQGGLKKRLGS